MEIRRSEHRGRANHGWLQIWVRPDRAGGDPHYQQRDFGALPGLRRVVSPDGQDGSLRIRQDMALWRLLLPAGGATSLEIVRDRAWVQLIGGALEVDGARLLPGDGLAVTAAERLSFTAHADVEALVFDLQ